MVKINKQKIRRFLKDNSFMFVQLGVLLLIPAVGLANDAQSIEITPIQGPLTKLVKFVSGPLAGTVTIGSIVTGIASYQMGWEQSITKKAAGAAVCGGASTQVDSLCSSLGIIASSMIF